MAVSIEVYRSIQNGVVCVEVDQGIPRSKSDIIDIYRGKSRPQELNPVVPP